MGTVGFGIENVAAALIIAAVAVAALTAVVRFEQLCLGELADTADFELQLFTRQGWTALIVLAIPLGGIAFLSAGRIR